MSGGEREGAHRGKLVIYQYEWKSPLFSCFGNAILAVSTARPRIARDLEGEREGEEVRARVRVRVRKREIKLV